MPQQSFAGRHRTVKIKASASGCVHFRRPGALLEIPPSSNSMFLGCTHTHLSSLRTAWPLRFHTFTRWPLTVTMRCRAASTSTRSIGSPLHKPPPPNLTRAQTATSLEGWTAHGKPSLEHCKHVILALTVRITCERTGSWTLLVHDGY